jgi:hypothetical protein
MNDTRLVRTTTFTLVATTLFAIVPALGEAQVGTIARTPEGRPDLNGIWQALNSANWNVEGHAADQGIAPELGATFAVPPGLGVVEGGEIPYRPGAAARREENVDNRLERDPEMKCFLPGVPRATYMPHPFQIVQTSQHILIVYQYASAVRAINMEDHQEAPISSWMGWSNGRWDGDTLIVDVTGLNGQTWLDRAGNYISENAHLVERYTPLGPNHLDYEVTIDDPGTFTRPWTMRMPLYRRREENMQLMEFKCVEFAEEFMYGHLRKQPDN